MTGDTPTGAALYDQAVICTLAELVNSLSSTLSGAQQTQAANALARVRKNCQVVGLCSGIAGVCVTYRDKILAGTGP